MGSIGQRRHGVIAVACAAVVGAFAACGGNDEKESASEPGRSLASRALQGRRVSDRDQALQLIARGVVAPLHFSDRAHVLLAGAFESSAAVDGATVSIVVEAADNAQGLLLRGETGFVRAVVRFEDAALSAATRVDGVVVLEVSRAFAGAAMARRTRADALTVSDGSRTLNWSYLDIEADTQQTVQTVHRLNVVSDVPLDGLDRVWLDATSNAQRYTANGVIGFLNARLTLALASDGGWRIEVDNDRDDRVDFEVQISADEAANAVTPRL